MKGKTAVVIGASGLIGSHLVEQLLHDDYFTVVRIMVRKMLPLQSAKLEQEIVDFDDIKDYSEKFGNGDIIFCCVGTTTKKVKGDITAYEKVDVNIPVNAAITGISKNFKKFLVVSSAGANSNSKNFYLQLKGKMENAIKSFGFEGIYISRPGQLLGKRNEYRKGERFLQGVTKFLSLFLLGSLKKYHSIKAKDVAKAMIAQSKLNDKGIHILEYKQMMNLITSDQHRRSK